MNQRPQRRDVGDESLPPLPVMRLLMVSPGRIASTQIFDLVFRGLAEQGAIEYAAVYDSEATLDEQMEAVLRSDVVFLLRSFNRSSLHLLRFAKQMGKLVVYSTDDDFRELDPETPLGRLHHDPQTRQSYESLINEADLVWLYTEEMRRRYASDAKQIVVGRLPSFVEINAPRGAGAVDGDDSALLVIGYGGSSTHEGDLRVVVRPLLAVLDAYPHVRAQFVNDAPRELARHPQVEVHPFVGSLLSYYEFLRQARWSIGLAPLQDTPFNRGKTSNKFRECAGLGVPGIYSRMPVYADSVRHGETGYLADHDEASFADALREMVENADLRRRIRVGGLQEASSRYALRGTQLHFLREISKLGIASGHRPWNRPTVVAVGYARTSSMQIGVLQPARRLASEGLATFHHVEPDRFEERDLDGADAVLVLRAFEERTLPLLDLARSRGLSLISSWDDDFLEIPPGTAIGDHYRHPSVVRAIVRYLRESSLVIASTPPLFARSHEFNDRLLEAPYGLDLEALASLPTPPAPVLPPGVTRIGFYGSNDALALPWMVEALAGLVRRFGAAIEIEAIGLDPTPELRPLLSWFQPGVLPYAESLQLMRARGWAIGLAPLEDSIFNATKQATKFRDYAWSGAAIVCSRVPAYQRTLLEGVHASFADESPGAWIDAVAELIEKPERARRLREGAARLLNEVHTQEWTNATWVQLLWRIGTARAWRAEIASAATDRAALGFTDEGFTAPAVGGGRPATADTVVDAIGGDPTRYTPLEGVRRYRVVPRRPAWTGLEVCVASSTGAAGARLSLEIALPDGQVLRRGEIDLRDLRSGTWARFEFPEVRNADGHAFDVRIGVAEAGASIGIFESLRVSSRFVQRVARRLGVESHLAAPFLRLLHSGAGRHRELETAEGAAVTRAETA